MSSLAYFRKASNGLSIFTDGQSAPIEVPGNYKNLDGESLLNDEHTLKSLASCYQEVFGSSDIWGEGWRCSSCGRVFARDRKSSNCDCGHVLDDYYPIANLCQRIVKELDQKSFCTVMLSDNDVAGFCWGTIGNQEKVSQRISANSHVSKFSEAVKKLLPSEGIIYFDELGIRKDSRAGLGPINFLTRLAFERGYLEGVNTALFWTARKSPIYRICRSFGFVDIYEEDGIVFLLLEDIVPVLKVMQNKTPAESAFLLAHGCRLTG